MLGLVFSIVALAAAAEAEAASGDSIRLGSVSAAPGTTAKLPVYLLDVSGTRLGADAGPDALINFIQFMVEYTFPDLIDNCASTPFTKCGVRFIPDGVLAGLSPASLTTFKGSQTLLVRYVYSPSAPPIPFTIDQTAPGDLIGYIAVDLAPSSADPRKTIQVVFRSGPNETVLANKVDGSIVESDFDGLDLTSGPVGQIFVTQCPVSPAGKLSIGWSGDRGCSLAVPCSIGENITFNAMTEAGYTLQDCDIVTWSFADETAVVGTTVTHAFADGGDWRVSLNAYNSRGGGGAETVVTVDPAPGTSGCTSCSATVPVEAKANRVIDFLSGFPDGCEPQVAWTFGDGSSVGTRNAAHIYSTPGTYTWRMTLRGGGAECIRTGTITIVAGTATCHADCSANVPTTGVVGVGVPFRAVVGCAVTEYSWSFGDNMVASGTGPNVAHTYEAAGTYDWSVSIVKTATDENCFLRGRVVIAPAPVRRRPVGRAE
ncbi:MAG: Chitinase [Acidobacteria bacterium]|nr:Chitinase [Acidobacteriota bacterium]